jgi:hypothetical protein
VLAVCGVAGFDDVSKKNYKHVLDGYRRLQMLA